MNKNKPIETRFRSVLPHEAQPANEPFGYVHIQGAFTPRLIVKDKDGSDQEDVVITKNVNDNIKKNDKDLHLYLPDVQTVQSLLLLFFQGCDWQSKSHPTEVADMNMNTQKFHLPHTNIISVEIDGNENENENESCKLKSKSPSAVTVTKARLVYPSASIAKDVVSFIRSSKITPASIFLDDTNDTHKTNMNMNMDMNIYTYTYSSKAIQATQVTKYPMPPPTISWPKVDPPKFRRLLPNQQNNDEEKLSIERSQTRFIFITNLIDTSKSVSKSSVPVPINDNELDPYMVQESLRNALQPYCISKESSIYPLEIFLVSNKLNSPFKYCHIGTRSPLDVQSIITTLQGKTLDLHIGDEIITTGNLFLDYVSITQRSEAKVRGMADNDEKKGGEAPKPQCTSTTDSVHVPGLVLVPDIVSIEEERTILAVLTGPNAPWAPSQQNFSKTGNVKRRVQHYGYVFDYETADVLRDRDNSNLKACCPPMPALPDDACSWDMEKLEEHISSAISKGLGWDTLAGIIERVRRFDFSINNNDHEMSYDVSAGDSDAYHESSKRNCADTAIMTTTTTTTTMRFAYLNQMTLNEYKRGQGIGSHVDTKTAFDDGLISVSLGADSVMEFREQTSGIRKLVHLPPRSMLLMSGPARYSWEHMIVSRGTDLVNNRLIPRQTRISLTLRTGITLPYEENTVKPLDLVQSRDFPPRWGNIDEETNDSGIATPITERQHVHAVYDAIAKQWHHTRGKRGVLWPGATIFLQNLPRGSIVADVGCGDGKYFPAIWQAGSYVIGTDISLPLLETSVGACTREGDEGPELRQVSDQNLSFNARPPVAVADCMNVPLRSDSCDAAICIAVMHHLSTHPRRIRCLQELARIVKKGGTVNVQAWAFEQETNSRRKFAGTDVFVPFNSQPRYLDKVSQDEAKVLRRKKNQRIKVDQNLDKKEASSVAEMYSEAYDGAEYDEKKGLVVFQRYCHMYREGELESLVSEIDNLEILESGFENGNHFVIFRAI